MVVVDICRCGLSFIREIVRVDVFEAGGAAEDGLAGDSEVLPIDPSEVVPRGAELQRTRETREGVVTAESAGCTVPQPDPPVKKTVYEPSGTLFTVYVFVLANVDRDDRPASLGEGDHGVGGTAILDRELTSSTGVAGAEELAIRGTRAALLTGRGATSGPATTHTSGYAGTMSGNQRLTRTQLRIRMSNSPCGPSRREAKVRS